MISSKNFFCIRGYMKSGTNWVCRILNCHPEIDCVGEFHWETFFQTLEGNVNRISPKRQAMLRQVVRPELEAMVGRCLISFADENANWIGDRTPTTITPIVLATAPHIVVIRDVRDVIVSRVFHLYNNPRVTRAFDNFPDMQSRLKFFQADRWYFRDHPDQLLANEEIVRDSAREWCEFLRSDCETIEANPALPVKKVRYEDIHRDFDKQVASLFSFLKLDSPTAVPMSLRPGHESENPNQLNRQGQVGDWKTYMTDQAKTWIIEEAGDELFKLGYINSLDW